MNIRFLMFFFGSRVVKSRRSYPTNMYSSHIFLTFQKNAEYIISFDPFYLLLKDLNDYLTHASLHCTFPITVKCNINSNWDFVGQF